MASQTGMLVVESFLHENYLFRRNLLNGKVEFITKSAIDDVRADNDAAWRTLTDAALKSIIIRAKREDVCEGANPKGDIQDLLQSEEVRAYDPVSDYLLSLPKWDGQGHVAKLFSRLPGLSSEMLGYLTIWLRSAVAHWMQMDTLHGNECVPTLIGPQGCGKTTFLRRLLPPHLRQYYLDHLNLSNKFDKEMALTNNLLVNLDELEAIRPSQHSALKQTLSKNKVNGRPIYGASQEDRVRYASFVATTNNPHPLTDATGSRRYLCLTIPEGQFIDNTGDTASSPQSFTARTRAAYAVPFARPVATSGILAGTAFVSTPPNESVSEKSPAAETSSQSVTFSPPVPMSVGRATTENEENPITPVSAATAGVPGVWVVNETAGVVSVACLLFSTTART